jgi:cell division protein FtsZ
MGVGEDESLGDAIAVTIVATGFNKDQQHEISNVEAKKIIHTLNDEQEASYDFSEKNLLDNSSKSTNEPVAEIEEDKIVYDLGEEIEEEPQFDIIQTSEVIKNIDVVYEEISSEKFEEFVITDVKAEKEEPVIEPVKEEKQISFTFDLPISQLKKEPVEEVKKTEINNIEVVAHQVIKPKKVEEDVYFTLEDYTELEENLTRASKPATIEKRINDEPTLKYKSEPKIDINDQEVVDFKEVSPLDLTIAELQKRATERREKMKNFNYKFINKVNKNIDEIEKEPAYKRMGVELNQTSHSSQLNQSRTTLNIDDNDDIQFRSNNSFLHDNVD